MSNDDIDYIISSCLKRSLDAAISILISELREAQAQLSSYFTLLQPALQPEGEPEKHKALIRAKKSISSTISDITLLLDRLAAYGWTFKNPIKTEGQVLPSSLPINPQLREFVVNHLKDSPSLVLHHIADELRQKQSDIRHYLNAIEEVLGTSDTQAKSDVRNTPTEQAQNTQQSVGIAGLSISLDKLNRAIEATSAYAKALENHEIV